MIIVSIWFSFINLFRYFIEGFTQNLRASGMKQLPRIQSNTLSKIETFLRGMIPELIFWVFFLENNEAQA